MLAYWLIFGFFACMASKNKPKYKANIKNSIKSKNINITWFHFTFLILILFIGFRYEVGGDWFNYLLVIENAKGYTFYDSLKTGDPAYYLINWLGANWFGDIYLVNILCAVIFSWGLIVFSKTQPRPWLALLSSTPYLLIAAMGYSRQGAAIGLVMLAYASMHNGRIFYYIFWIFCASLFHKTAIILIPIAILFRYKNKLLVLPIIAIISYLAYIFLFSNFVDKLEYGYLTSGYESDGALVRILMNALPAIIFLFFYRGFNLNKLQENFWIFISLSALLFLPLFLISPSSVALDRVALYWIPIQIFVFSRLPDIMMNNQKKYLLFLIILYNAVVLFVWLNFANHAKYWLPYKFYPWIHIWS
jgi:hypothetical protein